MKRMMTMKTILATTIGLSLLACGGSGGGSSDTPANEGTPPGPPSGVTVATGTTAGTAVVSFTAPTSSGSGSAVHYTVTAEPGGATATGPSSPVTLSGLTPAVRYSFSVVASNDAGDSAPATTGLLAFYDVVETFEEPECDEDTVFTGTFTYDATALTVSQLRGSLTESMTGEVWNGVPMDTVPLLHQLSSAPTTAGGVDGLRVTTFALETTNTFDPSGFAPQGDKKIYYGHGAGAPNPVQGGVGNAYAMIFVNTADPATPLAQAQIDELAYADCTAGGMMGATCMTGTTVAGYGRIGTMKGYPVAQVITAR